MPDYYITKYALTDGITKLSLPVEPDDDGHVWFIDSSEHRYHSYKRRDWHFDFSAASARANDMRLAKIASLRKQIVKLEKMTFTEPTDASN